MAAAVSFLVFWISVIAFVVYWWKKRRARIFAGEHYLADENYRKMNFRKKIAGFICIVSVVSFFSTLPEMTPEERAAYQAKREQEKIEEKRIAEEKAQKDAEERRIAEEKQAQERAERQRIADEKRIAEEKANDPYYEYQNGDKGLTGYELWASVHLAKEVHDFSSERKKLPFFGNPTMEELAKLASQKENYHLVRSRWNYIGNDSFTTYSPGADALVYFGEIEDEAPTGIGILAWYISSVKVSEGNYKDWLEPAYIGNFKNGRFHGYGILFAKSLDGFGVSNSPADLQSGIFYEGEFDKGELDGKGIVYAEVGASLFRNKKKHYDEIADLARNRGQKIGGKFYILSGKFSDNQFDN